MSSFDIHFEPHIRTITEAGRSHFHRPVDAIAEYIDNSIQACTDLSTSSRDVRVCIFLDTSQPHGFFLILDNGSGMDVQTIQEFATYSLDQKTRRRAPAEEDKSFIGKFGVGAKQAGFYLGTRIKLFTKPAEYREKQSVLSFCLDSDELHHKHNNQESVYAGVVREIDLQRSLELLPDEQSFPDIETILQSHFREVPHGSAFLVKLRSDEIIPKLKAMKESTLEKQIKDIYHFHLHPDHCPENIVSAINVRDTQKRPRLSSSQPVCKEIPLKITYELYYPELRKACDLHDERDFFQDCVERATDVFRFKMEAPLPGSQVDASRSMSQMASQVRCSNKYVIHGFFLYFPFKNGKETIPSIEEEKSQHTIHIYWQNRLVPAENELSELFFFPTTHHKTEVARSQVARNWRGRIAGFLFFGWEFDFIANNKLRFLVNLNEWFNVKANTSQIITFPKQAPAEFLAWLGRCHGEDREYVFLNRDRSSDLADLTFFQSVSFRHTGLEVKVGDKIKIQPSTKSAPVVYGEVCSFVVDGALAAFETYFFGHGKVRYKRLPLQLFGSKVEEKPITCLDADDAVAGEKDMTALKKEMPSSVDVFLFEKASDNGTLLNKGDAELMMGFKYWKIGVQIKNADKEIVCHLPDSGTDRKQIRYSVSVRNSDGKDYGKTADLFRYDESSEKDVDADRITKRDRKDCFYSVYNVTMSRPGPKSFTVSVFSPFSSTAIFSQDVCFNVTTMQPERFDIVEKEFFAQLGQPFPSFEVRFFDCMGQCVPFQGEVKLEINSELMRALPRDRSKELVRKISVKDEGVLLCKQGDWVVVPKPDTTIFSTETVEAEKEVKFSLALSIRNADRFDALGSPVEFKVKYSPGPPAKFAVLQPQTQPVKLQSGEALSALHVGVLDHWGHRVAPKPNQQWSLRLGRGPLALRDENKAVFSANGELLLLNVPCNEVSESTIFKQSLDLHRSGGKSAIVADFQSTELQIEVIASIRPSSIKILRDGEELGDSITCKAGETLSKLTFVVYDENDDVMDMSLRSQGKSSWIECDWTPQNRSKKKKISVPADCALPDIDVPEDLSASPFEPTLTVVLDSCELDVSLRITIVPAEPAKWSLVCAADLETTGVVAGESDDLQKKISGAVWTDRFGNHLPCDTHTASSSGAALSPFLELFVINEDTMELDAEEIAERFKPLHRIALQQGQVQMSAKESSAAELSQTQTAPTASAKKRRRSAGSAASALMGASQQLLSVLEGFILPSSASLECPPGCKEIVLRVVDDAQRLSASESLLCRVAKSLPKQLLLSCEALGVSQPAREIALDVSSFSSVSDLCIHLCDAHGGEASLQDLSAAKIEVLDSKGRKVFSSNNITTSVVHATLKYDFSAVEDDAEENTAAESSGAGRVVDFECKMSFRRGREHIALPPARLRCTVKKLNNVVDLKMQAYKSAEDVPTLSQMLLALQAQEVPLRKAGNTYSLSVPCDAALPTFTLLLETDDGRVFLPELETFSVSAKRRVGKDKSRVSFMDLFDCEIDEDNCRMIFNPTEKLASETLCVFEFEIVYKEKRGAFASLPEDKKLTKIQLHVHFLPGSLKRLSLDSFSLKKIQNRSVSNSKDPRQRLVGDNIRLQGRDAHDNVAAFSAAHEVRCRVVASERESLNDFLTDAALPRLRGADERGFIKAVVDKDGNECKFSRIELDSDQPAQCRDGDYFLRFSLCETKEMDEELLPVHVVFKFTSNETNVRKLNELHSKLEPLRRQKEEYTQWKTQFDALARRLSALQAECPPQMKSAQMNVEVLRQLQARRVREIEDMRQQITQHRAAQKHRNAAIDPVKLEGEEVVGQVVDLGFVDDLQEAKVLSWASNAVIDAVLVRDTNAAKRLYSKKIKVLALSQLIPYKVRDRATGQRRARTEQEMKSGMLDLPPIVMVDNKGKPIEFPADCKPRYLVNLIRLDPEHEELRDTLFFNAFSNSILFHSMDDALSYREYLVKRDERPPTLFTIKGERITSNAVMDPGPGGRLPAHLDLVYGEQKTKKIEEMRAQHDLDLLKDIIEVVEEIKGLKSKIEAVNIDDICQEISQLEEREGVIHFSMSQSQTARLH